MIEQFQLAPGARDWIHLFWMAPAAFALCLWGISRRWQKLQVFGYDPARSAQWLAALRKRRLRRAAVFAAALLLLTAAAVQPRCNPEKTRYRTTSRDLAVVLDVSKSMLADDLKPNRLERAKLELERLADRLHGRVGLIVFAGDAVIKSPLTANYSYFKRVLKSVDPRSASQGGSRIGDAVRKALTDLLGVEAHGVPASEEVQPGQTVLADERKGKKETFADILLITDGEDMDSYPVHAAKAAGALDVGIYAVGLGSEEGTPIPIQVAGGGTEYVRTRDGEIHRSKLDAKTLYEMVTAAARGFYWPVGTSNFDLVDFYETKMAVEPGREVEEEHVFWTEIFQPFLLGGIALYLAHILIAERPRRGRLAAPEMTETQAATAE